MPKVVCPKCGGDVEVITVRPRKPVEVKCPKCHEYFALDGTHALSIRGVRDIDSAAHMKMDIDRLKHR